MSYTEKFTWAGKELIIKRETSPVQVISAESADIKLEKLNINDSALRPSNYARAEGTVHRQHRHLSQLREVDLHSNRQERMRFACVHDPGSGRHIDGSKKILSCAVLEMCFAELNAFGPLNHHRHAWELRRHKWQAPPSEPHQMNAGHHRQQ
jgi:hypothetical protein